MTAVLFPPIASSPPTRGRERGYADAVSLALPFRSACPRLRIRKRRRRRGCRRDGARHARGHATEATLAESVPPSATLQSKRPRNGWSFWGGFRRARLPPAGGAALRRDQRRHIQAVPPLQAHRLSPNPFSIQSSLLYPLTVLRLILLPPIARSAALFVHRTSRRRRRHNSARHFPLSSTRMRRRVASPSRTMRSGRRSSKSPSKGGSVSSRHILALTQSQPSIPSRRFHARFFIACEVAEPLHESVRVAFHRYVQPQNLTRFGVRDYADVLFHAFHANRGLVRAYDFHLSARALGLFAARVSSSFLDVAPRAHARDRDSEGGGGRLAERGDMPSAHASAAHPRIRWVRSPRSNPSGQCLKALPQSERRYRTTVTFSS